jgi:septal ring factor EnvC (AmiA/AmiB activator)
MKTSLSVFLLVVAIATPGRAQWAVFDVANLAQSITNYAVFVEQLSNEATQISNQIQQIQQFETQLKRMGDMSTLTNLTGFSGYRSDLGRPTQIKRWTDTLSQVNGSGLFGDTRSGVYPAVTVDFPDFDGSTVVRNAQVYKPAQDTVVTVDEFKAVQSDVYQRRVALKQAIAQTSDALQAATTEAEEKKLGSLLAAQYGDLAALDSEVALSAAEAQVKAAESAAMANAQTAAEAEARRYLAQQEAQKVSTTFKPAYECPLQYVSEQPLSQ